MKLVCLYVCGFIIYIVSLFFVIVYRRGERVVLCIYIKGWWVAQRTATTHWQESNTHTHIHRIILHKMAKYFRYIHSYFIRP